MTLPLFPATDHTARQQQLREIFKNWLAYRAQSNSTARNERALREESAKVYQEMWHAFAAYCAERNLDIVDIEADDIQTFLVTRGTGNQQAKIRVSMKGDDPTPRYAWRMLTLIDRVTRFHARREGMSPNPAAQELLQRPEYRYANASRRDPLPGILWRSADQAADRLPDANTAQGVAG